VRTRRFWLAVAMLLAVMIPAGAAAQTSTSVSIGANALLVGLNPFFGQSQINVPLRVQCDGLSGGVSVSVTQQRPPFGPETGFGGKTVTCTGQPEDVVVSVFGPAFPGFEVGSASASATLSAGTESDTDQRTIHIVAR
jgi:hypothetical protein